MKSIHTIAEVDKDGNVTIAVGREYSGQDVQVLIQAAPERLSHEEWIKRIEETAGSIDDPTFRRPQQGILGFKP